MDHIHDWLLARVEPRYEDGAWGKAAERFKELDGRGTAIPIAIGTMGLFYCRQCLEWTTRLIPKDLPGFGG